MTLPGFYGKMPATGDFVTRRLSGDFVRAWDRWLAQHLVPLFGSGLLRRVGRHHRAKRRQGRQEVPFERRRAAC